jgi:hypothetical protein
MTPLHNIHPHHAHASTPCSLWRCEFLGCDHSESFKSRAGLKSHIRLVHSSARPGLSQQHPPHTPNTRHNLQPLTVPLSPSFPPLSPLRSSSSESESDLNVEDYGSNDFTAMHVGQTRLSSPASHTSSSPTNSSPTDIVRSYHPIINGSFFSFASYNTKC